MHYKRSIQYNAFKKLFLYCRLKKSLKRTQRRVQMKNSMSLKIKFFKKFVTQFEKTVTERRKNETLSLGEELEGLNRSPNGKELHLQGLMSARTIQPHHNQTISKINSSLRFQNSQIPHQRMKSNLQPELLNSSFNSAINRTMPVNDLSKEEKIELFTRRISDVRDRKSVNSSVSRERRRVSNITKT